MNALSDDESSVYITNDEFFSRNLHNKLTGGIAVLGDSLLYISRLDDRIKMVSITPTCAQCIEKATTIFDDGDDLSEEQRSFIEALEFNTPDFEDSATKIGQDIALLPSATVLELCGIDDLLDDDGFFVGMFDRISSSETITKIIFRGCHFSRCMWHNLSMIFYNDRLKEVEFWKCQIDSYIVDALRDCDNVQWERMFFDECTFDDGVHAELTRLHADISSLIHLEYNNCVGIDDNWQRLLRDGDFWRCAVPSNPNTNTNDQNETSQLLLQRSAIVRTNRERSG